MPDKAEVSRLDGQLPETRSKQDHDDGDSSANLVTASEPYMQQERSWFRGALFFALCRCFLSAFSAVALVGERNIVVRSSSNMYRYARCGVCRTVISPMSLSQPRLDLCARSFQARRVVHRWGNDAAL